VNKPDPEVRRRVTISDVAEHLGVSRATVSYALTRPDRVAAETLERVQEAIAALGYRGNAAARQLRVGHSQAIAMVVSDAANPIFSAVADGATAAADERGDFILVGNASEDLERERKYLEFFEEQQVSGIVIAPVAELPEVAVAIRERGTPVVHLGTENPPFRLPFGTGDDDAGGHLAIQHLTDIGRRRLLFIGGPALQFRFRRQGAFRAAKELGIELVEIEIPAATIKDAYQATLRLLESGAFPHDGVFAGNDLIGIGFIHAALEHGVNIPGAVAVVGYDDIAFAETTIVPLTTVGHDMHAMGVDLVKLLAREPGDELASIRHPPVLTQRRSTTGLI
jgi:LacI family transcriptional regulator